MIGSAIRFSACVSVLAGVFSATSAHAQARAPVQNWTGFYIGAQLGGGWSHQTAGYAPNDDAAAQFVNGSLFPLLSQPFPGHGLNTRGVTGGIELGYNWQIAPRWVAGIEADFSGATIKDSGSDTSMLAAPVFPQTVTSEQKVDWWGTVRARFGWLASQDMMLFGTAGLAYGRVATSHAYAVSGPAGNVGVIMLPNFSISCDIPGTCMAGSDSSVKAGWTLGGGGEWRWSRHWSLKAEYLYVNLGMASVTATALATTAPGQTPGSYTVDFGRTDFHVARIGVNYQF